MKNPSYIGDHFFILIYYNLYKKYQKCNNILANLHKIPIRIVLFLFLSVELIYVYTLSPNHYGKKSATLKFKMT